MDKNANLGLAENRNTQHCTSLTVNQVGNGHVDVHQEEIHEEQKERRVEAEEKDYPWVIGWTAWCRKYFWEGQTLQNNVEMNAALTTHPCSRTVLGDFRRFIALLIPLIVVHFFWWSIAVKHHVFSLFPERFALVITMVFASFFAGLTSIGGGAIAFPVLTLILKVSPEIARDFSLMIQSVGMTSATFTILFLRLQVEWQALIFSSCGGLIGLITGLEFIEHRMTGALKKMIFSSFWFSFSFSLFMLNRYRKRLTFQTIPLFTWWKCVVLLLTGFVGGVFTSFVGSGLDICSLSVLTLFFRLTEKTATPTAVILMAGNSLLGLFWRQIIQGTVSIDAWHYMAVCAPVVAIGAPLGSLVGSHFHRLVLACIINLTVTTILISSFALVPLNTVLIIVSVAVIIVGAIVFLILTLLGQRLLKNIKQKVDLDSRGKDENSKPKPQEVLDQENTKNPPEQYNRQEAPNSQEVNNENENTEQVGQVYNEGQDIDQPREDRNLKDIGDQPREQQNAQNPCNQTHQEHKFEEIANQTKKPYMQDSNQSDEIDVYGKREISVSYL